MKYFILSILIFNFEILYSQDDLPIGTDAIEVKKYLMQSAATNENSTFFDVVYSSKGEIQDVVYCSKGYNRKLREDDFVKDCRHYLMSNGVLICKKRIYENVELKNLMQWYDDEGEYYIKYDNFYFNSDYNHFTKLYIDSKGRSVSEYRQTEKKFIPENIWKEINKKIIEAEQLEINKRREAYELEQKERQLKYENQKIIDEKLIKEYISLSNLQAKPSGTGLYYIITKMGIGVNAGKGSKVTVKYKVMLLDGTVIDESKSNNFEFTLGAGMVIPGLDEGITLLNPGSKAKLLVPSTLGYGDISMGDKIPANSILLFDVELLKVQKSK